MATGGDGRGMRLLRRRLLPTRMGPALDCRRCFEVELGTADRLDGELRDGELRVGEFRDGELRDGEPRVGVDGPE